LRNEGNPPGKESTMALFISRVADVVVYTNNAGGGSGEIQAPTVGEASMEFVLPRALVREAWYCAIDNIGDLPAIRRIVCEPGGDKVNLQVAGSPGQRDARVRIRIYAAFERG
jgi:hypothetical protein